MHMASTDRSRHRVSRCLFDQRGHFLWVRFVDRVAGALHFDRLAVGTLGVHAFQIGVDDAIGGRYRVPAWLGLPCGLARRYGKYRCGGECLRARLEQGLSRRQVGGEIGRIMCRIEIQKTVGSLLDVARLADGIGVKLAIGDFGFALIERNARRCRPARRPSNRCRRR